MPRRSARATVPTRPGPPHRFRPALEELAARRLPANGVPTPDHVVVVVEENQGFAQVRGNPDAPYLNALADGPGAALFANSYAVGHPSQPNYLALFSGADQGVSGDAVPAGPFATPNLGAALLASGRTFAGFSEDLPAAGSLAVVAGEYARKHNPWSDWQGAGPNSLPAGTNLPFASFPADYASLPTVSFVVPNLLHDMHDGTVAQGDAWLTQNLGGYADWAQTHNSLLVVTFDEDDSAGADQIFTLFAGQPVRRGTDAERIDHFGVLRTIEDMFGLPYAGASLAAAPATGVWATAPPPVSPASPSVPGLIGYPQFAVGAGVGSDRVALFDPDGSVLRTADPFPGFTGGVRTAAADFNGDGVADVAAGTGPGGPSRVRVLDGKTGGDLFDVAPFETSFTGGVYVAAGDLNGDGVPELVVTPDEGGGPRVEVFDGNGFARLADFFGIDDPNFRGGARAAVGDVAGRGYGDLAVAAGFGGGPRVATFDGKSVLAGAPVKLFGDFLAFAATLRNGVYLAVGDLDGDGHADLIFGGGPGGGPRVLAFSGAGLLAGAEVPLVNFFAGDAGSRGGVPVAVKNLDGDDRADVVTGSGTGNGSHVRTYLCNDPSNTAFDFDALPGVSGGAFVG